jgi:hypothetical protein
MIMRMLMLMLMLPQGALNSAVDRAFGSNESAEWNEEITRREEEMRTGRLGKWT